MRLLRPVEVVGSERPVDLGRARPTRLLAALSTAQRLCLSLDGLVERCVDEGDRPKVSMGNRPCSVSCLFPLRRLAFAWPGWRGFGRRRGPELPAAVVCAVQGLVVVVESAVAVATHEGEVVDVGLALGRCIPRREMMGVAVLVGPATQYAGLVSDDQRQ